MIRPFVLSLLALALLATPALAGNRGPKVVPLRTLEKLAYGKAPAMPALAAIARPSSRDGQVTSSDVQHVLSVNVRSGRSPARPRIVKAIARRIIREAAGAESFASPAGRDDFGRRYRDHSGVDVQTGRQIEYAAQVIDRGLK